MVIALQHKLNPGSAVAVDSVDGLGPWEYRLKGDDVISDMQDYDLSHVIELAELSVDADGVVEFFGREEHEVTYVDNLAAKCNVVNIRLAQRAEVKRMLQEQPGRVYLQLNEPLLEGEVQEVDDILMGVVTRNGQRIRVAISEVVQWLGDSYAPLQYDALGLYVSQVNDFPVDDLPIYAAWVDVELIEAMQRQQEMADDPFFAADDSDFEEEMLARGVRLIRAVSSEDEDSE